MKYHLHARRRRRLARALGEGALALIPGAMLVARNSDVDYPFRQDSDFLYLTGLDEPGALLLIVGGRHHREILFSLPKDELAELWTGERVGQERARREYGIAETYSNGKTEEMETLLMRLLFESRMIAYPKDRHTQVRRLITTHEMQTGRRLAVIDTRKVLGEMRLIKKKEEIALMQMAGQISGKAHRDILAFIRPGMYEYQIEARMTSAFRDAGGDPLHAYPPIVAGGKNACILHYTKNNATLRSGELLLIDAGCEIEGYASDITRTFPISGVWSEPQRTLYNIVLRAQVEAIASAQVGVPLAHLHDVARRHIISGLLTTGLITAKDEDDAFTRKLDKEFFPHGTSHWLGLDVHDAGDYLRDEDAKRSTRRLEAGMVITIEPGLYIRSPEAPPEYQRIGIRIEDDILVTKTGPVILSALAPKDPDEIEMLMASGAGRYW